MFKSLVFFIIFFTLGCLAYPAISVKGLTGAGSRLCISSDSSAAEKAVAKLKNFSEKYITEKAYLHFDKPYYAAGDTIYFKAYLTIGQDHVPSGLSGVLHVDLINTNNKIDQSVKLQVNDGVTCGDFALPDSLPAGNYRVRAYTRWMRNEGDSSYFYQTIPVGSTLNNKIPESGNNNVFALKGKPDLQFFPEGGEMVAGVLCKIAFKAVGVNGLGIDVKGVVTDETGSELTTFASAHLGMGYFILNPVAGKTYKASVIYPDGTTDTIQLPAIVSKSIGMAVTDSVGKYTLSINSSRDYLPDNKGKRIYIVINEGGSAAIITGSLDSTTVKYDIQKRRLHPGIMQITLFSETGEPLCERMVFVANPDRLNLTISAGKRTYTKRELVQFNIHAFNRPDSATMAHFSVSVTDEGKVPVDENIESTILNNLLLTSNLKGNIEQPNYYFTNITDKTLADLDLVMLTHGYHGFIWKQILVDDYPPQVYTAEKGLEIAGVAKNLFGRPLARGTVSLMDKRNGSLLSAITDNNGQFKFDNLAFDDTGKFILQATNAKGKDNTRFEYAGRQSQPVIPVLNTKADDAPSLLTAYLENNIRQRAVIAQYGEVSGKMLKTVVINDKKINNYATDHNLVSPEFADQFVLDKDLVKGGLFSNRIEGVLHGVIIKRSGMSGGGTYAFTDRGAMQVVVDGQKTDGDLDKVNADDIESIEVLKNIGSSALYGGPALVINTKKNKGLQLEDIASIGILPISPQGYYKAQEFYSPKYNTATLTGSRPDLRSTIYWKPELVTGKDGNASFSYYNADGPGTYRVVIEGIDDKGNLGRQVYRYQVE